MKILLILSIYLGLAVSVSAQSRLGARLCELIPNQSRPFLRIHMSPQGFQEQIQDILKKQMPEIIAKTLAVDLQDKIIGETKGACAPSRESPGISKESSCLYVPKILLGEPIHLRKGILAELKESRPFRIRLDDFRITHFDIQNPEIRCEFRQGAATCLVQADVPNFEMESQLALVEPESQKTFVTTISKSKLKIEETPVAIPKLLFEIEILEYGPANERLSLVEGSLKLDIPDGSVSSEIGNDPEDRLQSVKDIVDRQLESKLTGEDREIEILQKIANGEADKAIETVAISYAIISGLKSILGENDILALYREALKEKVSEPLRKLLAELIEKALPFNENREVKIPFNPVQDELDGARYIVKFNLIQEYLSGVETNLRKHRARVRKVRQLRDKHMGELKAIKSFLKQVQSSQLKELGVEADLLALKIRSHLQDWDYYNALNYGLRLRLNSLIELAESLRDRLNLDDTPEYSTTLIHIDDVGKVDATGLEVLVSGCHIGGIQPTYPDDWNRSAFNETYFNDNEFSIEVPVPIVNQYLEILNDAQFFDYCQHKGPQTCAEKSFGSVKTVNRFLAAPQIVEHKGQYYLDVRQFERSLLTPLPDFIDDSILRLNTRAKICLKLRENTVGQLVPRNCVNLDPNHRKNLEAGQRFGLLSLFSTFAFFGLRVANTVIHEIAVDQIEDDKLLERTLDDVLLRKSPYKIREVTVENNLVTVSGQFFPKSE